MNQLFKCHSLQEKCISSCHHELFIGVSLLLSVGVNRVYPISRCRGTREPPSLMWLKDRHTNKHCTVYSFQRVNTLSNVARN